MFQRYQGSPNCFSLKNNKTTKYSFTETNIITEWRSESRAVLLEQTDHQIISWGCHSRRQHTHRPPTAKQVETSGVWEKPFHKWALVNGTEPVMRCCTGDQMASRWEKIYPLHSDFSALWIYNQNHKSLSVFVIAAHEYFSLFYNWRMSWSQAASLSAAAAAGLDWQM